MTDGFLSRWSKRKIDVKQGKPLAEPEITSLLQQPAVSPRASGAGERPEGVKEGPRSGEMADSPAPEAPAVPAPTLADAQGLTADSDFKPFMARGVASDVKNAAMKKLFTDPHYNVMDRLDTYIDDYSLSDPIPEAMLRTMVSAQFLKLFEETDPSPKPPEAAGLPLTDAVRDDANTAVNKVVAQSSQSIDTSPDALLKNDHTDMRLQPDHATANTAAGRGTA